MDEKLLRDFKYKYGRLRPVLREVVGELSYGLNKLVNFKNIKLAFPIQSRIKLWHSIEEKLKGKSPRFKDIIDIQDLIGIRIVPLYLRDVDRIVALISEKFDVYKIYDTRERLEQNQFGYSSKHIILRPPRSEFNLYTMQSYYKDYFENDRPIFHAEIQVRSAAQHIWSEASHELVYKKSEQRSEETTRIMARVSALLELVDLEIERILNSEKQIDASDSLDLTEKDVIELFDEYWPAKFCLADENYTYARWYLFQHGIRTDGQLRALLEKQKYNAISEAFMEAEELRNDLEKYGVEDGYIRGYRRYGYSFSKSVTPDLLERLSRNSVVAGHVGLMIRAVRIEFGYPTILFDLPTDAIYE
jgi:putative GTP pyrophosphokinase